MLIELITLHQKFYSMNNETALAQELIDFIYESPSPYQVVTNIKTELLKNDYQELSLTETWKVEKGKKYFVTKNDSAIFAISVGNKALAETGILLIFGTVLPMYLLYRGTERLTSVHTALYRYIQPLVATTLALARHQETVDQIHLLAGGAIFGGVLLMVLGTVLARRKQRAEMLKQP